MAALAATATVVTPTFAQTTTPTRATLRAAAVTQSNALRTARHFQLALDTVMPYAGDNNFDVFIAIGQAIEGFTTPADRLRAIEWYNRAIALAPTNKNGYIRRAAAWGDAGTKYLENRLADRETVVRMSEEQSPTKTAPPGEYSDLAGANASFVLPSGGVLDLNRRALVLELRSKAIALGLTAGRLLDRAEFINSRYPENRGMGRGDVDQAMLLTDQLDLSTPAGIFETAQVARRIAALNSAMTLAGLTTTIEGVSTRLRPTVGQLRNEAIDNYSKYIALFESSGRDYARFGSGIGAYENRAAVKRSLGDPRSVREAIADYEVLIQINPRNAGYWRNYGTALDAIGERGSARRYYQEYLNLMGEEDDGNVGAIRARLAQG